MSATIMVRTPTMTANTTFTTQVNEWHDSVDQLTNRFTESLTNTEQDAFRRELQQLIDAAVEQSESTWEPGDQCPECGDHILSKWVSYPELTKHENGKVSFQDGSGYGTVIGWGCTVCETPLRISPVSILLPTAPGTLPADIEVLPEILESQTANHDWEPGTACPVCHSNSIGEQPVDAYAVTSRNGRTGQQHTGERHQTIKSWCDSCGEALHESKPSLLLDSLSL